MTPCPLPTSAPMITLSGEDGTVIRLHFGSPNGFEAFWIEIEESRYTGQPDGCQGPPRRYLSDTYVSFREAVANLLDPHAWWRFHPLDVNPGWATTIREALSDRFPSWWSQPDRHYVLWREAWTWQQTLMDAMDRRWTWSRNPSWTDLRLSYTVAPSYFRPYGIYLEWDRNRDSQIQAWPIPSKMTSGSSEACRSAPEEPGVFLNLRWSRDLISRLHKVQLRPIPSDLHGCDGTSYELTVAQGAQRFQLRWWQDLSEEASELRPLQRQLDRCMGRLGYSQHVSG